MIKWLVTLVLIMLQLVGCTQNIDQEVSAENIVKSRAAARWQARIEGRLDAAYAYETPEYRKVYTLEQYKQKIYGVGLWRKAEAESVRCSNDKCVVNMRIYVTMPPVRGFGATEADSLLKEQWIWDAEFGEWFHVSNL